MKLVFVAWIFVANTMFGCAKAVVQDDIQLGVSQDMAEKRSADIGNLSYHIRFSIPDSVSKPVLGTETIRFDFKVGVGRVILDFTGSNTSIKSVLCNDIKAEYKLVNEHIVIPASYFKKRGNAVSIEFEAGDKALNRKEDFMYTLFVPDRARTVFPCFDQPDLKAHFNLELEIPQGWTAISNAYVADSAITQGKRVSLKFKRSELISTYLFSFTAGKFFTAHKEIGGKKYTILYRENDAKKVAQNINSLFSMVDYSVKFMEDYTGIPYPFSKYDLAIIPDFQFGGMEHPGSVYYTASKMWLSENATTQEKLARAELIAHETAHMWFGDLVTMKWFNDVWMKEVFAGFFADKIVKDLFPEVNSDLQFMVAHAPKAYAEDRTLGTNPIRQKLDNLNLAGTMYGNIIYHKAPVAIRSLEKLMGPSVFQNALREYLKKYSLGNAAWNDLVAVFDKHTKFSVSNWSKSWIESAGMPTYTYDEYHKDGSGSGLIVQQESPNFMQLPYLQLVEFSGIINGKSHSKVLTLGGAGDNKQVFNFSKWGKTCDYTIANSDGFGYGYFELDSVNCASIASSYFNMENPMHRASCLINLYENMLNGNFDGVSMVALLSRVAEKETNEQIINLALDYILTTQLYYIPATDVKSAAMLEASLWKAYSSTKDKKLMIQYLRTISRLMKSDESVERMLDIWKAEVVKDNSWIASPDLQNIAFELSIQKPDDASGILSLARKRIKNIDNLRRFDFVSMAVAPNKIARDKFFETLLHVENRKQEAWVADALKYLNHPIRSEESKEYLAKGLSILPEIQQTGDIFFPKSWIAALLYGHSSKNDYSIVEAYIEKEGKLLSPSLLAKVYQASDILKRSTSTAGRK